MDLHISTTEQLSIISGWNGTSLDSANARIGDNLILNLYFYDLNLRSKSRPYDLHRYAAAAITAKLIDINGNQLATQSTFSEIVPATTAPSITRVVTGTTSIGEYDRITLASPLASGSFNIVMQGGSASQRGATSASAKVIPTVTNPRQASAAFASMLGAPWNIEFVSDVLIDVHGSASITGTTAHIVSVDVSDASYLYGWTGTISLSGVDPTFAQNSILYPVTLAVLLTPSGGSQFTAAKAPINLQI